MSDSLQTESLSGLLPVWTVACQAPLAMGFSRQELWSGLPFPSPGGLPDPRIKPESPTLQAVSLPSEPLENPKSFIPASLKLHLLGNALFSREEPVWTPACRDCSLPGSFGHGISRREHWSGLPFPSPGIFLTQGSNLSLPHCRQTLYHLSHWRIPNLSTLLPWNFTSLEMLFFLKKPN